MTENLVEMLEAIEAGAAFKDPLEAAKKAVADDLAAAELVLFPDAVQQLDASVYLAFRFHVERWGNSTFRQSLENLHARCVEAWPALAALLRSPESLADVEDAARSVAPVERRAQIDAAREARAQVMTNIAHQLSGCEGHELFEAAAQYVASVALRCRVEASEELHASAAAEALDAAKAAVIATEALRRAEAATAARAASVNAAECETVAKRAAVRARQLKADELKLLIEARPEASIRVGGELFDKQYLLDRLHSTDDAMLARVAAALEGQLWV